MMGDLLEVNTKERGGIKRRLRGIQESCRVK